MKKGFSAKTDFIILIVIFSICLVLSIAYAICYGINYKNEKEEKRTDTYTMGGYAVNSVTIETDDWNVWRVHGYEMIEDEYYIVTFDDNGTMNVDDDIILNIEKANPPKN